MAKAGKFVDGVFDATKAAWNPRLHSNKAINPMFSNFTGAVELAGEVFGNNNLSMDAVNKVFREGGTEAGKWNAGTIAGSAVTLGAVGRVMSGGGVYKDGQGNTNLPGLPFV